MEKLELKKKLALGTVQFGSNYGISNSEGQTSADEVAAILNVAHQNQIKFIDTAFAYGNAEEVLGKNNLQQFQIVSKFISPENVAALNLQLTTSLKRLNVKSLYGYLAHRPLELIKQPAIWDELIKLKSENKIQKIGFSLNEPNELDILLAAGFKPDLVQVPFNYFDNRFRQQLIKLKQEGCEIHTRSAFLQGLFFSKPHNLSSFFDEVKPYLKKLQEQNQNLNGALLHFALKQNFIDLVVIGVENATQLKQNLEGINTATDLPDFNFQISEKILTPSAWQK